MLRSLHSTSGRIAGSLRSPVARSRYAADEARPTSVLERLVARLLGARASAVVQLPLVWMRRSRYRQELANLNETQLEDVGLDPYLVHQESAKPFWMS